MVCARRRQAHPKNCNVPKISVNQDGAAVCPVKNHSNRGQQWGFRNYSKLPEPCEKKALAFSSVSLAVSVHCISLHVYKANMKFLNRTYSAMIIVNQREKV